VRGPGYSAVSSPRIIAVQKETFKQKPGFKAVVEIEAAVEGILEIKAAVEVEVAMCRGRYRSVEVK
jgi:hypothetical protein